MSEGSARHFSEQYGQPFGYRALAFRRTYLVFNLDRVKFTGQANEYLELSTVEAPDSAALYASAGNSLTILWFETGENNLQIDGVTYPFQRNQVVCLTEFHHVEVSYIGPVRLLRFNRPFYCIVDHDKEVSCKGVLFFGASQVPVVSIPEAELETFETLWRMFQIEMQSRDELQFEMLQTMLKRYLILITRLYKQQSVLPRFDDASVDVVRELNYLVEQHFRTKHTVAEYAELMNRSPKTISNLFSKLGAKTPLQYIQDRKMLEARRQLRYTERSVKEIAYDLGYEDIQAFSRFFKTQEQVSPSEFRTRAQSGKIANAPGITA